MADRGFEQTKAVSVEWLAAMLRNYVEQDEALKESGAIIVQPPGDQSCVYVLQKGGDHLLVQVSEIELRIM